VAPALVSAEPVSVSTLRADRTLQQPPQLRARVAHPTWGRCR
jgi:hypothetical protein